MHQQDKYFFIAIYALLTWGQLTLSFTQIATVCPRDHVIHPGDSFIVNCKLMETAITSGISPETLFFKHQPTGITWENATLVATQAHQVAGNDTMQIHVTNVTWSDAGFYKCYSDDGFASISSSLVQIGEPPGPTENFTCVLYNFERMACSWEPASPTDHRHYTMTWRIAELSTKEESRSECKTYLGENRNGCELNDEEILPWARYIFTVTAEQKFGESSAEFDITADTLIMQVGPVRNVVGLALNATSICVSWEHVLSRYVRVWYRLNYTNTWDDASMTLGVSPYTSNSTEGVCVNDLEPYTNYILAAEAFVEGTPYPPKPRATSIRTLEAVPLEGPQIMSFRYHECDGGSCMTIYWKDIPDRQKRGEILLNEIAINNTLHLSVNTPGSSAQLSMVDSYSVISIKGRNSVGPSPATTFQISAPNYVTGFYGEKHDVNRSILFTWNATKAWWKDLKLISCYSPDGGLDCLSELVVYDLGAPPYLLTNAQEGHVYGVTAISGTAYGGMTEDWGCIHNYEGKVPKPNFEVVKSGLNSLILFIHVQACRPDEGKISRYVIYHGVENCNELPSIVLSPADDGPTKVVLTDLASGVKIQVCVRADGRTEPSAKSSQVAYTLKPGNGTLGTMVAAGVAVVFFLVIVVTAMWALRHWQVKCHYCNPLHVEYPAHTPSNADLDATDYAGEPMRMQSMSGFNEDDVPEYIKSETEDSGTSPLSSGGDNDEGVDTPVVYSAVDVDCSADSAMGHSVGSGRIYNGGYLALVDEQSHKEKTPNNTCYDIDVAESTERGSSGNSHDGGIYLSGCESMTSAGSNCTTGSYYDGYSVESMK